MTQREPASPCIRACTLDTETDVCLGCYRTLQEILDWSNFTAAQKTEVLKKLPGRKTARARRFGFTRPGSEEEK